MSKLIQFFLGCYHFYIYCKCPNINTFKKTDAPVHGWLLIFFASIIIQIRSIIKKWMEENMFPFYPLGDLKNKE